MNRAAKKLSPPEGSDVLVVVDMQEKFNTAQHPPTIDGCIKAISRFKERQNAIIFLEYWNAGITNPSLMKIVEGYDNFTIMKKSQDDGSQEVLEALSIKTHYRLWVCGVNIDACVIDTVEGCIKKGFSVVTVIRNACNGNFCTIERCWEDFDSKIRHSSIDNKPIIRDIT